MKILKIAIYISALMLLAACGKNKNEPAPPEPTPPEAKPASRTVLVYMVADNSLGSGNYDVQDLEEMCSAAKGGQIGEGRLLVYHSPQRRKPVLKEVMPDGSIDTLKTYDDVDLSITVEQMRQVIADAKELAPARDYGMVLWSHALGWLQDGIEDELDPRSEPQQRGMVYSFGIEQSKKKMNTTALGKALEGQGFSFIYFDCCFMGSVEVMYELRGAASTIVASPAEDHICGMPYQLNLKHLFAAKPDMMAAAKTTFDYYMAGYNRFDCPETWAVINMEAIDELAAATREIYERAPASLPAGYNPQPMAQGSNCYYYDFADYVRALCATPELAADPSLLARFDKAMARAVPYAEHSPWIWGAVKINACCGLTTYIMDTPEAALTKGYNQLSWYADVASAIIR